MLYCVLTTSSIIYNVWWFIAFKQYGTKLTISNMSQMKKAQHFQEEQQERYGFITPLCKDRLQSTQNVVTHLMFRHFNTKTWIIITTNGCSQQTNMWKNGLHRKNEFNFAKTLEDLTKASYMATLSISQNGKPFTDG